MSCCYFHINKNIAKISEFTALIYILMYLLFRQNPILLYCILSLFIAYAIILQDEKDKGGRSDIDNLETEYLQKQQKKKQG
jgi:hypothetical protein